MAYSLCFKRFLSHMIILTDKLRQEHSEINAKPGKITRLTCNSVLTWEIILCVVPDERIIKDLDAGIERRLFKTLTSRWEGCEQCRGQG